MNSITQFDKTPLLSPTGLSSQEQQLLMDDMDNGEKENKPSSIRIKTFKSFQQYESARIGTSRGTYLKPIPV